MNPLSFVTKNLSFERDRWFLWAPLAIGFGIVIYFQLPFEPSLWLLMATPVLVLAVWFVRKRTALAIILLVLMLAALGFNARQVETKSTLKHDKFAFEQWQEKLGNPDLIDGSDLPSGETQLRCDDRGCTYRKYDHVLAVPGFETAALEDYEQTDIVVAPFLIKSCSARIIIDDPELWHHGARAIYFRRDGSLRIDFVRKNRDL